MSNKSWQRYARVSLCRLAGSCYCLKKGWNRFRSVPLLHILKIPVRHCLQNTCKFCGHTGEFLIHADSKSHWGRVLRKVLWRTRNRHIEQKGRETCVEFCRMSKYFCLLRDIWRSERDVGYIRGGDSGDNVRSEKDAGSTDKRKSFRHDVFCHIRVEKDSWLGCNEICLLWTTTKDSRGGDVDCKTSKCIRESILFPKTLIEMDGFWVSNFGIEERATGASIPVMSSSLMNLLCVGLLVAGWTAARTEYWKQSLLLWLRMFMIAFFFWISAGVGMKDEPAAGRNAPTHRQIQNFTNIPPRSMARERFDFFVEGRYYAVDVERVGGWNHGRQIETRCRVLQFVGVGYFSLEFDVCPEVVLDGTKTTK